MDIRLHLSVLWRFRIVVGIGLLVAIALTVLSVAKISAHGLSYRQKEDWTGASTVWVTQAGFPLGRSVYDKFFQAGTPKAPATISQYSDPSRFSSLATIYVSLITSDPVMKLMAKEGPVDGAVAATQPSIPGNASITLPFVQISGTATSAAKAVALTNHATRALIRYVEQEQAQNAIPKDKRVVLQVVNKAESAVLTKPRKKTTPIVVFVASLMMTIGLAFLLENLRPRIRSVDPRAVEEAPPVAAAVPRRSA